MFLHWRVIGMMDAAEEEAGDYAISREPGVFRARVGNHSHDRVSSHGVDCDRRKFLAQPQVPPVREPPPKHAGVAMVHLLICSFAQSGDKFPVPDRQLRFAEFRSFLLAAVIRAADEKHLLGVHSRNENVQRTKSADSTTPNPNRPSSRFIWQAEFSFEKVRDLQPRQLATFQAKVFDEPLALQPAHLASAGHRASVQQVLLSVLTHRNTSAFTP